MKSTASAVACSNIALIKYWGKRDSHLNLPAVGSISLTLAALQTKTSVTFTPDISRDELILGQQIADETKTHRVSQFLDLIRDLGSISLAGRVVSENSFPTGAGLASSASAFAALALAATAAAGLIMNPAQLSVLARRGSGSAARSVFGGFAEMNKGLLPDGSDAHANQLAAEDYWDLRVLIVITSEAEKKVGSTGGMDLSAASSPYYKDWLLSSDDDLILMREAIKNKDFTKLGELSEFSCLKMHSVMLSSRPALIYWNAATMAVINKVRELRSPGGTPLYFTIDAGPQVKLITLPEFVPQIKRDIETIPGVRRTIESKLGPGVMLRSERG
jgi:diphosphomevalonate decarboxylase